MTAEHRDKFRFSYLIIAHCSTFSKDKLHYYYVSIFLTSFPINHKPLPPLPLAICNISVCSIKLTYYHSFIQYILACIYFFLMYGLGLD